VDEIRALLPELDALVFEMPHSDTALVMASVAAIRVERLDVARRLYALPEEGWPPGGTGAGAHWRWWMKGQVQVLEGNPEEVRSCASAWAKEWQSTPDAAHS
jgi:hypothetical protein